jgi:hypothetical protein
MRLDYCNDKVFICFYLSSIFLLLYDLWPWRSGLRRCATCRKLADSIPDGFDEIFHWSNPSGRNTTLRPTQSLREMSTRDFAWVGGWGGGRRPVCMADNLTTFMCWSSRNSGSLNFLDPVGMSRPAQGYLYFFITNDQRPVNSDNLNKRGNVRINVTLRQFRLTIFALVKQ